MNANVPPTEPPTITATLVEAMDPKDNKLNHLVQKP